MITNPHRRKQIEEFTDKDRAVMHEFYDITEDVPSFKKFKSEMERLIEKDPQKCKKISGRVWLVVKTS